jgi:hypothetical protein
MLLFVVASRGIPTRGQGVKHLVIFVGTRLAFGLSEINLEMRLGTHGQFYGLYGLVIGCHAHKEEQNILIIFLV